MRLNLSYVLLGLISVKGGVAFNVDNAPTTLGIGASTTASTSTALETQTQIASPTAASLSKSCTTSTASVASACATNLPAACRAINATADLTALVQQLPSCKTALGAYDVGDVDNICLVISTPHVTGQVIYNCLVNLLSPQCITAIPQSCTDLQKVNGSDIFPALPDCVTALGPFDNDVTAPCLDPTTITDSTSGASVVSCLNAALGLTTNTTVTC